MIRLTLTLAAFALAATARADEFRREGNGERRETLDKMEGKAAPAFAVKDWMNTDGKKMTLKDLRGKVVVIDFWGTWCPPCRRAIPHLKELYAEHKKDGLVVIGVHTTNGGEKCAAFVKGQGIKYPVAIDVDRKTTKAYNVDSFPDYYVLGRDGKLVCADLANAELDKVIAKLLKQTP